MAISFPNKFFALFMLSFLACSVHGQLSEHFYDNNCPKVQDIVLSVMNEVINTNGDKRMGASILRLFFHDCFVNGCDGGPLLDSDTTGQTEKTAGPNANSLRGFDVIDKIKKLVESSCPKKIASQPGAVSCADILVLAARDSVNLLGGPKWNVTLGRKDTRVADPDGANSKLPGPGLSISQLFASFNAQGFSAQELTALSGAHTIGKAKCKFFRSRIYGDKNIDAGFAATRKKTCPRFFGDNNLAPLDVQTEVVFDNNYYDDLAIQKGLFHSDQELFNSASTSPADQALLQQTQAKVIQYRDNGSIFASDFAAAMMKLANLPRPRTVSSGEFRLTCSKINTLSLVQFE